MSFLHIVEIGTQPEEDSPSGAGSPAHGWLVATDAGRAVTPRCATRNEAERRLAQARRALAAAARFGGVA